MPENIGYGFSPAEEGGDPRRRKRRGAGLSPVQEAIRILSLRLPRVLGAGALAPASLLGGPGGAGLRGSPAAALALQPFDPRNAPGLSFGGPPLGPSPQAPKPRIDVFPNPPPPTDAWDTSGGGVPNPRRPPRLVRPFSPRRDPFGGG